MARKSSGTRSQLIHCDNCDEEYSATYKRCPFCGARPDNGGMDLTARFTGLGGGGRRAADSREDPRPSRSSRSRSRAREEEEYEEYEDDYVFDGGDVFDDEDGGYEDDEEYYTRRGGGKRLMEGGLSPTTIAGIAFSAVLFIAAILIVVLVIVPMVRDGNTEPATNEPNNSLPGTSSVSPDLPTSPSVPAVPDGEDPNAPATTTPVDDPNGTTTTIPAGQTATGFTLKPTDFTISDKYPNPVDIHVTFSPAGTTGTITWTTSNANVATVDANGRVTAVGKGSCTITASMPGAADRTCKVIVSISGGGSAPAASNPPSTTSPAPSSSPTTSSGSLSLNKSDISISDAYPNPVTLRASGGSGTITWSSSNTAVATVDANGKVTRVGSGKCTVTATDGAGNKAECIVRCG